jgi:hypothetical protein
MWSITNEECSFVKRVARDAPTGQDQELKQRLATFVLDFVRSSGGLRRLTLDDDLAFESWLERTSYSRKKKNELSQLHKKVCELPVKMVCKTVKAFIKNEAYPMYKAPRAILARSDEFKVLVGPMFKAIEELVYDLKSPNGFPYFIKKIPIPERPKVILENLGDGNGFTDEPLMHKRRVLVTDYSQFEASFTPEIMDILEMQLYHYMIENLPEFVKFKELIDTLKAINVCVFRHFKFKIKGRRMSGEMNTSLGNGFSNLMITLFTLTVHGCRDIRLFVEGDDCVCTYWGPVISSDFLVRLGFLVKLKYLTSPCEASFCGNIFDLFSLVVIADPIKILLNFSWINMKYFRSSHAMKMGLLRSRALSLIYQYSGCPVIQPFAMRVLELTKGFKAVLDTTIDGYHKHIYEAAIALEPKLQDVLRPVSFKSRELMFSVYEISISFQLMLEDHFAKMEFGPINCPIVLSTVNADMLHYYEHYVRQL